MRSAMRVGGGAGGEDMMVAVIMGPVPLRPARVGVRLSRSGAPFALYKFPRKVNVNCSYVRGLATDIARIV